MFSTSFWEYQSSLININLNNYKTQYGIFWNFIIYLLLFSVSFDPDIYFGLFYVPLIYLKKFCEYLSWR